MRKNVCLFLLFIALVSASCLAKDFSNQEELNKIEKETKECINNNYQTDYAMAQCVEDSIKRYNIEITKNLKGLKEVLSESQYEDVAKSQNNWESFIKQDNLMLENILEKPFAPYLPALTSTNIKMYNVKRRAQELCGLLNLYTLYKDTDKFPD